MTFFVKHLWYAPYSLEYKKRGKVRQGSLLKVEFKDGKQGHADLHPYPEKGEANLETYLKKLKQKEGDFLINRAYEQARTEALALEKGQCLLSGLKIPKSHLLILDIEKFSGLDSSLQEGFSHFKVKLAQPLAQQTKKLLKLMEEAGKQIKWRVDFSNEISLNQFQEWLLKYLPLIPKEFLDFVESPGAYPRRIKNYPLALDIWGSFPGESVDVLVCKPSRQNPNQLFKKRSSFKRVLFTHSLAHPLDQVATAYFASQFYKVEPRLTEICGLVQKEVYKETEFSLRDEGPTFPFLSGKGWGFDSRLWSKLYWKKLF